jgi:adenylate kinase
MAGVIFLIFNSGDKLMKLVLIGPPGSGKGTQAELLKKKFDIPHISSGNILRKEVADGTDFGNQIKYFMDRGEIGPEELITDIVLKHIDKHCQSGFILDGFPRTLYQAKALENKYSLVAAILLEIDDKIIIQRITGRRICDKCDKLYHIETSPPKKTGICDKCGSNLIQRRDDTSEIASNRIRVFNEETSPVIGYYKKLKLLHKVNANGKPKDIFAEILNIV